MIDAIRDPRNNLTGYKVSPHLITSTPIAAADSDTHANYRIDQALRTCMLIEEGFSHPNELEIRQECSAFSRVLLRESSTKMSIITNDQMHLLG